MYCHVHSMAMSYQAAKEIHQYLQRLFETTPTHLNAQNLTLLLDFHKTWYIRTSCDNIPQQLLAPYVYLYVNPIRLEKEIRWLATQKVFWYHTSFDLLPTSPKPMSVPEPKSYHTTRRNKLTSEEKITKLKNRLYQECVQR